MPIVELETSNEIPVIADVTEFEPSGCCGSSVSIYVCLSVLELWLGLGLLIAPSVFIGFRYEAAVLVPSCLLGFPFSIIMVLGAVFTIYQASSGAKSLPTRSKAKTRVILLWCLLVSSILLDIGLLVCTAITLHAGTRSHCDSCGSTLMFFGIAFCFLLFSLIITFLYIPLIYRATKIRNFIKG